jgi:hypothetical protein
VQSQAGHLGAAGLVGGDHAVGARPLELLLGVLDCGAGHDRDVRSQLARGERDEHVVRVGVRAGDDRAGPRDPGLDQHLVIGGVALDEADAQPLGAVAVAVVRIDHHVVGARAVQVAGHLAAHAAEAADDVVVGERVDHLLHAPGCQQVAEVPGDEELGDGGQRVEERTYAQHGQRDLHDLPGGGVRLRKAADGGGRVQRPAEAVPEPHALAERQPDRAHQQQPDGDRAERGDAPREDRQLPMCGRTGAVGDTVQDPVEVGHEEPR